MDSPAVDRVATTGLAWQQVTSGGSFQGWELTVSTLRDPYYPDVRNAP